MLCELNFHVCFLLSQDVKLLGDEHLTWAYCAPEVFTASPSVYDHKSDVWSVGIILFVLLSGVHPFDADGRHTKG